MTKRHGLMVQIAQPDSISIPFPELIFRDVRVIGSLIASPDDAVEMLDMVAKHKISVTTNPFNSIQELPKLIDFYESGKMMGKGIIIMDPDQIKREQQLGAVA